jgi:hypothetical protein
MNIPLWIDVARGDAEHDGKCSLFVEGFAVALPNDKVYVHQQSDICGQVACRVVDAVSGHIEPAPAGCLQTPFGKIAFIDSAGSDGWFIIAGSSEGVGEISIARYSVASGQRDALRFSQSPFAGVRHERFPGGLRFRTPCALPPGCEFHSYDGQPERTYQWTPRGGLVRID